MSAPIDPSQIPQAPQDQQGDGQAGQQPRLSDLAKGVSIGLMSVGAQMWGHAFAQALGDPQLEKTIASNFEKRIAPAIYDRWHQQEAQTFKAMVMDPWAQKQQAGLQNWETKMAQIQRGVVVDPDGKERKIDPFGAEAESMRSSLTTNFMSGMFSADQDVIKASTDPKWANNPYISNSVNALMKHRLDAVDSLTKQTQQSMGNRVKIGQIREVDTQADVNEQTLAQNRAKFDEWQTFKEQRKQEVELGLQTKKATIDKLRSEANLARAQAGAVGLKAKAGSGKDDKEISILPKGVSLQEFPNYLLSMKEGRSRLDQYRERLSKPMIQQLIDERQMDPEAAKAKVLEAGGQVDQKSVGLYLVDAFGGGNPDSASTLVEQVPSWKPYLKATGYLETEPKSINRRLLEREVPAKATEVSNDLIGDLQSLAGAAGNKYKSVDAFLSDNLEDLVDRWLEENVEDNPGAQESKPKLKKEVMKQLRARIKASPDYTESITGTPPPKPGRSFLDRLLRPHTSATD